jgi:hypothetical protein
LLGGIAGEADLRQQDAKNDGEKAQKQVLRGILTPCSGRAT